MHTPIWTPEWNKPSRNKRNPRAIQMRNRSKGAYVANVVDSASQFFEGRQSDSEDSSSMKKYGYFIMFVFACLVVIGVTVEINRFFSSSESEKLHGFDTLSSSIDNSSPEDFLDRESRTNHIEKSKKILRSSQGELVTGNDAFEHNDVHGEDVIDSNPQDAVGLPEEDFFSQEHLLDDRHIRSGERPSVSRDRDHDEANEPITGGPIGHRNTHHESEEEGHLDRHVGPAATRGNENTHPHQGDLDPVDPDFGIGGRRKLR